MKIALLAGGPSLERGISLNSARSVLDHLGDENIEIVPIYFDQKKEHIKSLKPNFIQTILLILILSWLNTHHL